MGSAEALEVPWAVEISKDYANLSGQLQQIGLENGPGPSVDANPDTKVFEFNDGHVEARERIGVRQIAFETDYPHQDSTWPNTRDAIARFEGLLDDEELELVLRGNGARLLGIDT